MRKIFISILITLFLSVNAYAEIYLIYKNDDKTVYSMSGKDDAVLPDGYTKVILPGDFSTYPLAYPANYYLYKNSKFVLNVKKIDDEAVAEQKYKDKMTEERLIQKRMRKQAIDSLKAENITLQYVTE